MNKITTMSFDWFEMGACGTGGRDLASASPLGALAQAWRYEDHADFALRGRKMASRRKATPKRQSTSCGLQATLAGRGCHRAFDHQQQHKVVEACRERWLVVSRETLGCQGRASPRSHLRQ